MHCPVKLEFQIVITENAHFQPEISNVEHGPVHVQSGAAGPHFQRGRKLEKCGPRRHPEGVTSVDSEHGRRAPGNPFDLHAAAAGHDGATGGGVDVQEGPDNRHNVAHFAPTGESRSGYGHWIQQCGMGVSVKSGKITQRGHSGATGKPQGGAKKFFNTTV